MATMVPANTIPIANFARAWSLGLEEQLYGLYSVLQRYVRRVPSTSSLLLGAASVCAIYSVMAQLIRPGWDPGPRRGIGVAIHDGHPGPAAWIRVGPRVCVGRGPCRKLGRTTIPHESIPRLCPPRRADRRASHCRPELRPAKDGNSSRSTLFPRDCSLLPTPASPADSS
jgi:hypothetical protein